MKIEQKYNYISSKETEEKVKNALNSLIYSTPDVDDEDIWWYEENLWYTRKYQHLENKLSKLMRKKGFDNVDIENAISSVAPYYDFLKGVYFFLKKTKYISPIEFSFVIDSYSTVFNTTKRAKEIYYTHH